jgi:hypothetical protein
MKTIVVKGSNWKKEFHCYGWKNMEQICSVCELRFQCLTDRDDIFIESKDLHIRNSSNITADVIADSIANVVYFVREDSDGRKVAKIDFDNVEQR